MQQVISSKVSPEYISGKCASGAVKAVLIAPLYVCMVAGTGGVYTPTNIQLRVNAPSNSIVEIRGYHTKRNLLFSVPQELVDLRDMFGLTMTDLAQIFGVSRPTVYAWLSGSEPKDEIKSEMRTLAGYVEELRNAGISQAAFLARQPLEGEQSLISIFKSGSDAKNAIATIKYSLMQVNSLKTVKRDFGPSRKTIRVSLGEISVVASLDNEDASRG
jgi:DNA-binding XRE family transcriptional regulator